MDDNRAKTEQCLWCGVSEGEARLVERATHKYVCADVQRCTARIAKRCGIDAIPYCACKHEWSIDEQGTPRCIGCGEPRTTNTMASPMPKIGDRVTEGMGIYVVRALLGGTRLSVSSQASGVWIAINWADSGYRSPNNAWRLYSRVRPRK